MKPAPFSGAKLAVVADGAVLTLQRDARADIPFPAMWDLPGGGREGIETPLACVLRETREELSLQLAPAHICWRRAYPGPPVTWFFGARLAGQEGHAIRLGSEGQRWAWMPLQQFLARADAVPHLQMRLREFLEGG